MPNTNTPNVPLPAGAVSGDVWEHGEQVTAGPLVIPGVTTCLSKP
jgi:hypothetical protein